MSNSWVCKICLLVFFLGFILAQSFEYNESLAFKYLAHSAAAYCHPDNITDWDCPICQGALPSFIPYHTFRNPDGEIFGYVGTYDKTEDNGRNEIVIAFRGTNPHYYGNWVTDLEFPKTISCFGLIGAQCHEGFYKAYKSVRPQIEAALHALYPKYPNAHITVTGHSMGGALAELCAFNLKTMLIPFYSENGTFEQYRQPQDVAVFTYGSPRVGNVQFARTYDGLVHATYRVVHNRDMIPHLPLKVMGFWHVGREVWYRCSGESYYQWCYGNYTICNASGEDPSCSDSLYIDTSIEDHLYYFALRVGQQCTAKPDYVWDIGRFPYL